MNCYAVASVAVLNRRHFVGQDFECEKKMFPFLSMWVERSDMTGINLIAGSGVAHGSCLIPGY